MSAINTCILDWYEIEYPRYLNAQNDSLVFSFPFITNNKVKNIKILNVDSNEFSLWKYGGKFKKYNPDVKQNQLNINDSVDAADKFVLNQVNKKLKPIIYYKKQFTNLRNPQNNAEYLTVTNKKFIPKANEYIQFVSSHYNIKTRLIDVDDIYDEFAYGYFNPESIKDFLKTTHSCWQQPFP